MSDFLPGFLWGRMLSNNSKGSREDEKNNGAGILALIGLLGALFAGPYAILAHSPVIALAFALLQRWVCYLLSKFSSLFFDGMSATDGGILNTYMIYKRLAGIGCPWKEGFEPVYYTDDYHSLSQIHHYIAHDFEDNMFHVASCDTVQFNWIG